MYVTDALYAISQTLSGAFGGKSMSIRFEDLMQPPTPEISEEEIVDKIGNKLRAMK